MAKKIIIKYRGELCVLNQKDCVSATGKISKIRPLNCKACRPIKYTTAKYKNAKSEIQYKIKQQVQTQINIMGGIFSKDDGPLYLSQIIYYKNTADVDAFNKLIFDSLKDIAITDDRLIKKETTEIRENCPESGFDMVIIQMNEGLFQ